MEPFAEALARREFLLLDGGLATELEALGKELSGELWSARLLAEDPDAILRVHEAYRAAGADVLTTATYQATIDGFRKRGFSASAVRDLFERAVSLARRAAGRDAYVAASVGPYGASLADGSEYRGDDALGEDELCRWHEERLRRIVAAAPDVLAMETIPSLREARALARAMRGVAGIPAWISFTCRDGESIADGTPLRDCAAHLDGCDRIVAVGVNCVAPSLVPSLLREARRGTGKPLVAYPNSGERWDARTRRWTGPRDPTDFALAAATWLPLGAKLIGGCCRTTPSHTLSLSRQLRPSRRPPST